MANPTHAHITMEESREDKNFTFYLVITFQSFGLHTSSSLLPLQAHRFDNGGEWAAIFGRHLGDELGPRSRIGLLRILGGIRLCVPGVVTEGAG